MHELSVATAILGTAVRHAEQRPVERVHLRVGALRQVVPASLSFYWQIVARDSVCDGADLDIELIPAELRCGLCEYAWAPTILSFHCPSCGGCDTSVAAGNELEIEYLVLRETARV